MHMPGLDVVMETSERTEEDPTLELRDAMLPRKDDVLHIELLESAGRQGRAATLGPIDALAAEIERLCQEVIADRSGGPACCCKMPTPDAKKERLQGPSPKSLHSKVSKWTIHQPTDGSSDE